MRRRRSFTLVELIVVIAVLLILIAIAIPAYLAVRGKATDTQAKSTVTVVYKNAKAHWADAETYAPVATTVAALRSAEPDLVINTSGFTPGGPKEVMVDVTPGTQGQEITVCSKSDTGSFFCLRGNETGGMTYVSAADAGPAQVLAANGVSIARSWANGLGDAVCRLPSVSAPYRHASCGGEGGTDWGIGHGNGGGGNEGAGSEGGSDSATAAPTAESAPVISGAVATGETLSASDGTYTSGPNAPTSFTYQWQYTTDGGGTWNDLTGQTSADYTPALADLGRSLRVAVTATNDAGSTTTDSDPTAVINASWTAPVAVSGASNVSPATWSVGNAGHIGILAKRTDVAGNPLIGAIGQASPLSIPAGGATGMSAGVNQIRSGVMADGGMYAAWTANGAGGYHNSLWVAYQPAGGSWVFGQLETQGVIDFDFSSNASGQAVLVWDHQDEGSGNKSIRWSVKNGSSFPAPTVLSSLAYAARPKVDLADSGKYVIAFADQSSLSYVALQTWTGQLGGGRSTITQITPNGQSVLFHDVAVTDSGRASVLGRRASDGVLVSNTSPNGGASPTWEGIQAHAAGIGTGDGTVSVEAAGERFVAAYKTTSGAAVMTRGSGAWSSATDVSSSTVTGLTAGGGTSGEGAVAYKEGTTIRAHYVTANGAVLPGVDIDSGVSNAQATVIGAGVTSAGIAAVGYLHGTGSGNVVRSAAVQG